MDGRGRCHDNIFVERLWWTVKHEWVYLRPAANGIEQKRSLAEFFDWYNPKALGIGLEALFLIELSKHERGGVDRFMTEVVEIPEVRSAFLITGRYDFVVHVVARDMQHLKDLALDRFTNRPGVARIETSIIYEARGRHELPQLQEMP